MYKKYKIKRKKKFNIYIIFAIIAIPLIFMSYGYSLWTDTVKITGTVNIKPTQQDEFKYMNVDIPLSLAHVQTPLGFKLVSQEMVGKDLVGTLQVTDKIDYLMGGSWTVYFINKTGYDIKDGKTEVNITGSTDAVGAITATPPASISKGSSETMFNIPISLCSSKILVETKIEITTRYNVNGETQGMKYIVIIKPAA